MGTPETASAAGMNKGSRKEVVASAPLARLVVVVVGPAVEVAAAAAVVAAADSSSIVAGNKLVVVAFAAAHVDPSRVFDIGDEASSQMEELDKVNQVVQQHLRTSQRLRACPDKAGQVEWERHRVGLDTAGQIQVSQADPPSTPG